MTVLVDTGVFFGAHNHRDQHHTAAKRALEAVVRGERGAAFTTSSIYNEAVTLMRARTGSFDEAKLIGDRILGRDPFPRVLHMLHVDAVRFRAAVDAFETYRDHGLSFTDATTVALVEERGIDAVASFDTDFDGIVERLDPREVG